MTNCFPPMKPRQQGNSTLFKAYKFVAYLQYCYQVHQGYAVVWINDVELERAHRVVEAVEQSALKLQPNLDTDDIWQKAVKASKTDPKFEREKRESERKKIEGEGIRDFQQIVSQDISESYLRWRGIEATLQLSPGHN